MKSLKMHGETATVSEGLILELHGKIPVSGEIIHYHNFELHVESVRKHRITMVKMVINEPREDED